MQDNNSWSRSIFIVMLVMMILIGAGCGTMHVNERKESTGSVKETSIEAEMVTMETVFDDFSIQIENIEDLLDDKLIKHLTGDIIVMLLVPRRFCFLVISLVDYVFHAVTSLMIA